MELKSVNHRFLDVNYRVPKPLSFLEEPLRGWIRQSDIRRGHLDVSVTYANTRADSRAVEINGELVLACAQETQALARRLQANAPSVYELIKLCDALTVTQAEENADEVILLAQEAFRGALEQLQAMREKEGNALRGDLRQNLNAAMEAVERIARLAPEVPAEYREKLQKRLREWQADAIDPARIAQEVALMADRCAIDEELSRLYSHFHQFALCLDQREEAGRRMDFLLQEMNREVNTIGTKAAHAQISGNVVELKSVLEKLREQVQNIE